MSTTSQQHGMQRKYLALAYRLTQYATMFERIADPVNLRQADDLHLGAIALDLREAAHAIRDEWEHP